MLFAYCLHSSLICKFHKSIITVIVFTGCPAYPRIARHPYETIVADYTIVVFHQPGAHNNIKNLGVIGNSTCNAGKQHLRDVIPVEHGCNSRRSPHFAYSRPCDHHILATQRTYVILDTAYLVNLFYVSFIKQHLYLVIHSRDNSYALFLLQRGAFSFIKLYTYYCKQEHNSNDWNNNMFFHASHPNK